MRTKNMRELNYFQLGASIYTPATHAKLTNSIVNGISGSRSLVICTEDAVSECDVETALDNLHLSLLDCMDANVDKSIIRLIRPRNHVVLGRILKMNGLRGLIDGFVLPKANAETLAEYIQVLKDNDASEFYILPTLETSDVFEEGLLINIRCVMDASPNPVLCVRIGGNDIMGLMGIKRMPGLTIYETPVRHIIDKILIAFRPHGYEISSPVFDYIDDRVTLARELAQDLNYGMFAKTAIHPAQVSLIENAYREYLELNSSHAEELLQENVSAVYQRDGQMMEATCHHNWAKRTMMLHQNVNLVEFTS
jgi:citrate lyase beta subunit